MRALTLAITLMMAALAAPAFAEPPAYRVARPMIAGAEAREQRLLAHLAPSARAWLRAEGRRRAGADPSVSDTSAAVQVRFPNLAGTDTEAMVFLVMMQAARDEQDDLQQIMAQVQAQNRAKQAARRAHEALADRRDSLSDLSSEQQMRMQMMMDRRSKFLEALSNIMKKISDTDSTMIGNLK